MLPGLAPADAKNGLVSERHGARDQRDGVARRHRHRDCNVDALRPPCFLVPGLLGAVAISAGWLRPEVPPLFWQRLLTIIGLNTGLSFTQETLKSCARQLPRIAIAVLTLVTPCARQVERSLGWAFHIDPLTAYLATTPGGIDAV